MVSVSGREGRRHREQTKEFKDDYRLRSGIEATNSEYKRPYGGGRLRVRGSPAVTRMVKFKFMGLNIRRWTKPARKTRNQAA
ncbi:MAG: transposase [bacterium]|nr:transposase [bacterium]